jgi:hypothetical protein
LSLTSLAFIIRQELFLLFHILLSQFISSIFIDQSRYHHHHPMTTNLVVTAVSDIYTTDHNRLPSVDCDAFGLTANVSGIKVWVIPLHMLGMPVVGAAMVQFT